MRSTASSGRAGCTMGCRCIISPITTMSTAWPANWATRRTSTRSTCCCSPSPACLRSTTAASSACRAKRTPYEDKPLRPCLELSDLQRSAPQPHLPADIARLAELRRNHPALRYGDYQQLSLASEQLAFSRSYQGETLVVLLNSTAAPVRMEVSLPPGFTSAIDVLNGGERFPVKGGKLGVDAVPAHWGCVLKL